MLATSEARGGGLLERGLADRAGIGPYSGILTTGMVVEPSSPLNENTRPRGCVPHPRAARAVHILGDFLQIP